jgi:2-polyprenyl-3-methyl-5-hydroxy-6-metoxy-1,4-benzoquinol methylase
MRNCPSCGGPARAAFRLADRGVFVCGRFDCRLQFAHPQPSDQQLTAYYTQYYYGSGSPILENSPEPYLRQIVAELPGQIGPLRGKRVLDFGCGIGTLCRLLLGAGAAVEAVEADPRARETVAQELGIAIAADLREIGQRVPPSTYDVITMIDVVEHVRAPAETLCELRRLLKPDGFLFLSTPDVDSLRARLEGKRWSSYQNPTHLFYFNRAALRRVLREAGYDGLLVWQPIISYPQHGRVRRMLQSRLQQLGLDGALRIVARVPVLEPSTRAEALA